MLSCGQSSPEGNKGEVFTINAQLEAPESTVQIVISTDPLCSANTVGPHKKAVYLGIPTTMGESHFTSRF
jgi:hypothetical protein